MAVAHSTSLEYSRDNSGDLVWNSSTNSYTSSKPEHLYGWTDGSVSDITLYAWDAQYADTPSVLYTTDAVPTSNSKYYDVNGNEIQLSSITYDGWVATGLDYATGSYMGFECTNTNGGGVIIK